MRDILCAVAYKMKMFHLWEDIVRILPLKALYCATGWIMDPWNRLFRANS